MNKVTDELYSIDKNVDLVYSPDDGGWYLQLYLHDDAGNTKTSKTIFTTKRKALDKYAYCVDNIIWE